MCVHEHAHINKKYPGADYYFSATFLDLQGVLQLFAFIKRFVRFDFKTEQKIYVRRKTLLKLHKVCLYNLNNALY